ncbi:hypothetical protein MOQ_006311 [Trypanosoma cruzi marinkellei]|uniref:PDZ domain-containing protein n=1 Tax=Trypanosoma cruzi marinkellei TaxID=85056 RepID=K2NLY4_TRYCR|nr:hypothetical protein MOQ_006311 [Trypanosoma cruzi marinkellei]
MADTLMEPNEFQKLVGVLMKEKYVYEQIAADDVLRQHRQRTERSRSASRTPNNRRSLSNASLGSRAALQQSGGVKLGGRPPRIPSGRRTPNPAPGDSLRSESNDSRGFSDMPVQHDSPSNDAEKKKMEELTPFVLGSPGPQLFSNDFHEGSESAVEKLEPSSPEDEEERVDQGPLSARPPIRCKVLQSPPADHDDNPPVSACNEMEEKQQSLQLIPPLYACSRCTLLESKLQDMQENLSRLTKDFMRIAAGQAKSDGMLQSTDSASEISGNLKELSGSTEEKFLTVIIALAKRVRRLEADLEASLEQVRVMESAAIERDMKLNRTKVDHNEIEEVVAKALSNTCMDDLNELKFFYRMWEINPKDVRQALDSSSSTSCIDLLLRTPPFARVLRIMMDKDSEILNALHEQQRCSLEAERRAYYEFKPLPSNQTDGSLINVQKEIIPLHEQILGIYLADEEGLEGVRVISVPAGSPAVNALKYGDVIVQVNHVTVHSVADVSYVLSRIRTSAPVTLSILARNKPYLRIVEVMPSEIF